MPVYTGVFLKLLTQTLDVLIEVESSKTTPIFLSECLKLVVSFPGWELTLFEILSGPINRTRISSVFSCRKLEAI